MRALREHDWVQALVRVIEDDGTVASELRGVGHVLNIEKDSAGNPNIVNVYFERTGVTTIVHREDLDFMGGPDTGKSVQL